MYLSFLPGMIPGYKICKPFCLVTKLIIEVSLLTKMVRVAAIDKSNASVLLVVVRICLAIHFKIPLLKTGGLMH
jgi:hypothetical protein